VSTYFLFEKETSNQKNPQTERGESLPQSGVTTTDKKKTISADKLKH